MNAKSNFLNFIALGRMRFMMMRTRGEGLPRLLKRAKSRQLKFYPKRSSEMKILSRMKKVSIVLYFRLS